MTEPILKKNTKLMWQHFGIAMRLARIGTGFTLGDVARRFKIPVSTVSAMEVGREPDKLTEGLEVRRIDEDDQRVCMDCYFKKLSKMMEPCLTCYVTHNRPNFVKNTKE